jgi:hypothetical protein
LSGLESRRLALALALSLAAHLLAWGGCELGKQLDVQRWLHLPAWVHSLVKIQPAQPVVQEPEPLVFVEVNPEQATADVPKNTKYYSSQNSRAANPEADRNKNVPQLNGKQTEIAKVEDVPRPNFSKPQPAAPQANPQPETPRPMLDPGDLTLAKPEDLQQQQQQQQERPRTLQQAHRLPGQQMKQEGGVRRHLEISSLDAKATSFGAYDLALIDAVSQSWYHLLDQTRYASDTHGKVVIQFNLRSDGSITDLKIAGDTADDVPGGIWAIICQAAIENAAPFARWPSDMLHEIGSDLRDVRFTFYY